MIAPGNASHGVALLLAGWHQTAVPQSGDYLRSRIVLPLGAETLLALTYRRTEACVASAAASSSAASRSPHAEPDDEASLIIACGLRRRFARLKPITRLAFEPMPSAGELLDFLERLPHWPTILRAFNATRHWRGYQRVTVRGSIYLDYAKPRNVTCVRDHTWREGDERTEHVLGGRRSPYLCEGLKEWGNTIFAPVVGPTNFNTLWQLHGLHRANVLLTRAEAVRGGRYARVIVSRLDYVWLAAHPPLSQLAPADCAWVPAAEDYGGLNDRHAVLSRAHTDAYLGRWDDIRTGRLLQLLPQFRVLGTASALSGERTLAALLRARGVPVCRFAPVMHLACCARAGGGAEVAASQAKSAADAGSSTGRDNTTRAHAAVAPTRCHNPRCTRLKVPRRTGVVDTPMDTRGKYTGELRASVLHTVALRLPGAMWRRVGNDLAVAAPASAAAAFNESLRKALRGRGLGRALISWS